MTEKDTPYRYDAFISYSHKDADWVQQWLVPKLEAEGLKIAVDYRDFAVGLSSMVNMEQAVTDSRHTVLVLTPSWVKSRYTDFEALLVQTDDPTGLQRRLLPLMLQPCVPPKRISILTYADFREKQQWEAELPRLIAAIQDKDSLPERKPPVPPPPVWPKVVVGALMLVALLGMVWFFAIVQPAKFHVLSVIPSVEIYQRLPAIDDPVSSRYVLHLSTDTDTFSVNDLRKSIIFAGAEGELERALSLPEPDLYTGLDTYLGDFPDTLQDKFRNAYKAHKKQLETSSLQAGDAVSVKLVLDTTVVATGQGVIHDEGRITSIILK